MTKPDQSQAQLEAARQNLRALNAREQELKAAADAARATMDAACAQREGLIARAAAGDKAATLEEIRRVDGVVRDAEITLKIEEAKVAAIGADVAGAEVEVMRAEAAALSSEILVAYAGEASAFAEFMQRFEAAQKALDAFHEAAQKRSTAYSRAESHNSRADVDRVAHPNKPAANVWQPPRPVTITVGDGPTVSMTKDVPLEETSEATSSGDLSVLAKLAYGPYLPYLGELGAVRHTQGKGWSVNGEHDLIKLATQYGQVLSANG